VHPEPTWVVTAAAKDALAPVTWWFPIVGRVAYRGYYDREDADRFAARLQRQDLDVLVQAAGAFSTLGWLSDPIRPSMLQRSGSSLVNLVLHEAAHRRLYVKGQTDFNESFAAFVGDEGTLRYYRHQEGPDCPTCVQVAALDTDTATFSRFLGGVVARLEALYGGPESRGEKIRRREDIFTAARAEAANLDWETQAYAWFQQRPLDNAVILSLVRYEGRRELFTRLLAACDGNLPLAVAGLVNHIGKRTADPFAQVERLLGGDPPCPP
jgi:predicted aminopeptidase